MKQLLVLSLIGISLLTGAATSLRAQTYDGYQNPSGGYNYSDSSGQPVGSTAPNIFGGYTSYSPSGATTGYSAPSPGGGYQYFAPSGATAGYSTPVNSNGYGTYYSQ